MNKDINRIKVGVVIYQNAAQTDRSFWFFVRPELFHELTLICEKKLTDKTFTDTDTWEECWNLLYNYDKNEYHPDILKQSFTDPWGRYDNEDLPFNKYEITGVLPIKQVF
jgi:hypothetical protein